MCVRAPQRTEAAAGSGCRRCPSWQTTLNSNKPASGDARAKRGARTVLERAADRIGADVALQVSGSLHITNRRGQLLAGQPWARSAHIKLRVCVEALAGLQRNDAPALIRGVGERSRVGGPRDVLVAVRAAAGNNAELHRPIGGASVHGFPLQGRTISVQHSSGHACKQTCLSAAARAAQASKTMISDLTILRIVPTDMAEVRGSTEPRDTAHRPRC